VQPVPSNEIHKKVNSREKETAFGACLVEVGEVDAHPAFSVCFHDHDNIGEPLGELHLFYKFGLHELLCFFGDRLIVLGCKTSHFFV
jgi:hypothetical protein